MIRKQSFMQKMSLVTSIWTYLLFGVGMGSSMAVTVDVKKTEGKIMIKDDDCGNVLKEINEIIKYSKKRGIDTTAFEQEISGLKAEGACEINIISLLPENIASKIGQFPDCDGSNCFNFSLVATGAMDEFRPVVDKEMHSLINGPLCQEVAASDKSPGHIGVILDKKDNPLHAFTILGDSLVLSKDGMSRFVPWEIKPAADVYHNYEYFGESINGNKLKFFECTSINSYLENHPNKKAEILPLLEGWSIPDDSEDSGFYTITGIDQLESSLSCSLAEVYDSPGDNVDELLVMARSVWEIIQNAKYTYPSDKTPFVNDYLNYLAEYEASLRDYIHRLNPNYESDVDKLVISKRLERKSKDKIWKIIKEQFKFK